MHADLEKAIRTVLGIAHRQSMNPILVGGLASELATTTLDNPPMVRGTNDADFAIRMKNWEKYNVFKDAMVKEDFRPDPSMEHRLYLGEAIVDILPYGPEIAGGEEIQWPVAGRAMIITGFEEACREAADTTLTSGLTVRRVTVAGLVLLKIIAFLDRHEAGQRNRDRQRHAGR